MGARRCDARPELGIGIPPRDNQPAVVRHGAVPLACLLERPCQHLVQLRMSDVRVRRVERPAERRLQHRDRLARPTERQIGACQLEVGPGVTVRERPNGSPKFRCGLGRAAAGRKEQTPNMVMQQAVASVGALPAEYLETIREPLEQRCVASGGQRGRPVGQRPAQVPRIAPRQSVPEVIESRE